jgi:hypothetical protein
MNGRLAHIGGVQQATLRATTGVSFTSCFAEQAAKLEAIPLAQVLGFSGRQPYLPEPPHD